MMRIAIVLLALLLVASPALAQLEDEGDEYGDEETHAASKADDLTGKLGVGFNSQAVGLWLWGEGAYVPYSAAISVRYYFIDMVGIDFSLGFGWFETEVDGEDVKYSAMLAEPKVLVNFLSEEQAVLYGFGALGLLRYKYPESVSRGDVDYDTDTGVRLSGGVGVHWFFQGLPNLGFSAEFGGMYETLGDDQFLGTFGGMLTNFGIHYYFSF